MAFVCGERFGRTYRERKIVKLSDVLKITANPLCENERNGLISSANSITKVVIKSKGRRGVRENLLVKGLLQILFFFLLYSLHIPLFLSLYMKHKQKYRNFVKSLLLLLFICFLFTVCNEHGLLILLLRSNDEFFSKQKKKQRKQKRGEKSFNSQSFILIDSLY